MKALAVLSITLAFLAQAGAQTPPRELLRAARPLTGEEIAIVLGASRDALAGKTLRLSFSPVRPATEVVMGRKGQPRRVRSFSGMEGGSVGPVPLGGGPAVTSTRWREEHVTIVDYTGRPARRCAGSSEAGSPEQGELVIEYTQRSSSSMSSTSTTPGSWTPATTHGWTVKARKGEERELGGRAISPVFEMLQGGSAVTSGEHRQIRGRQARAFVAPWGTETPATQWLWIDTASLRPLRWEVSGGDSHARYLDIGSESFHLRLPAGLDVPDCIP
jgi:hypothetical protein